MPTYNKAHFSDEVVANMDKKISMILQCQVLVLDSIKAFLSSTRDYEQTENFVSFIHLAIKMRFNLDSAHQLLPLLKDDYRFKTSVNLLYRSCLDDTINLYYLLGFVLVNNSTLKPSPLQPSLGNELDILHREFLKSTSIIIESEQETSKYYKELVGENYLPPKESNWKREMIDENIHLYNENEGRWKTNKEIRASSSPLFNNIFPPGNGKVPESGKMDFIKNKGFARSSQLTELFKYFAQYQHFSPKMHAFLLTTPEHDLVSYHKMLVEMLCVIFECNQILVTDHKEDTKALFNVNILQLFELYHASN